MGDSSIVTPPLSRLPEARIDGPFGRRDDLRECDGAICDGEGWAGQRTPIKRGTAEMPLRIENVGGPGAVVTGS
jgi:hypothetical protein